MLIKRYGGPLVAVLFSVSVGYAQICFRGFSSDSCSSYPITDFTVSTPFAGVAGQPARNLDFATHLGWLFKVKPDLALGPSFFFSAHLNGGWHTQLGVNMRVRTRPATHLHLDLSPGLILYDSPFPDGFAGYDLEVTPGYRDWVGFVTRVNIRKVYPRGHETILQVGIKLGSYAGLGLTGLGAIVGTIGHFLSRIE